MKISYHWEEEDIKAGSYVSLNLRPEGSETMDYQCSVTYKVGYSGRLGLNMCLIAITDGMVIIYESTADTKLKGNAKQVLVNHFNSDEDGYRPLTNEEVMCRMQYLLPDA
jgi:hypothetical protein